MPLSITAEMIGATASVVVPVATAAVVYMRMAMGNGLKSLKLDMMKEFAGASKDFIRRGECVLMHGDLRERVDKLEKRVDAGRGHGTGAGYGR